jgi:hypothetical protein
MAHTVKIFIIGLFFGKFPENTNFKAPWETAALTLGNVGIN